MRQTRVLPACPPTDPRFLFSIRNSEFWSLNSELSVDRVLRSCQLQAGAWKLAAIRRANLQSQICNLECLYGAWGNRERMANSRRALLLQQVRVMRLQPLPDQVANPDRKFVHLICLAL